ncbi:MAG: hypothetical protein AAGI69_27705 [Cyanobacteria bacterium P01_H01_bin.21]
MALTKILFVLLLSYLLSGAFYSTAKAFDSGSSNSEIRIEKLQAERRKREERRKRLEAQRKELGKNVNDIREERWQLQQRLSSCLSERPFNDLNSRYLTLREIQERVDSSEENRIAFEQALVSIGEQLEIENLRIHSRRDSPGFDYEGEFGLYLIDLDTYLDKLEFELLTLYKAVYSGTQVYVDFIDSSLELCNIRRSEPQSGVLSVRYNQSLEGLNQSIEVIGSIISL